MICYSPSKLIPKQSRMLIWQFDTHSLSGDCQNNVSITIFFVAVQMARNPTEERLYQYSSLLISKFTLTSDTPIINQIFLLWITCDFDIKYNMLFKYRHQTEYRLHIKFLESRQRKSHCESWMLFHSIHMYPF